MGSDLSRCFGSDDCASQSPQPTAMVITTTGDLREYRIPATVSHVLAEETASSPAWFMCNSDRMFYDEFIPVLDVDDELQGNQIYFVLPTSNLQKRLTAADMAAMAVKASTAMKSCQSKQSRQRRRHKARISPFALNMNQSGEEMPLVANEKSVGSVDKNKAAALSRSGSVRRFQKYTSRRAKTAVRSFKVRLSTIQEGTPL